jgi:hypothetical protein
MCLRSPLRFPGNLSVGDVVGDPANAGRPAVYTGRTVAMVLSRGMGTSGSRQPCDRRAPRQAQPLTVTPSAQASSRDPRALAPARVRVPLSCPGVYRRCAMTTCPGKPVIIAAVSWSGG